MEKEPARIRPIRTECAWWKINGGDPVFSVANSHYTPSERPVLLLPPFGMSLANLIIPAIALAHAGCRVVRFDGRNNVGLSHGEILDFKLGVLLEDARLAAAKLVEATGSDALLIVGMSISAPVALKLAAEYERAHLLLLAPAIDLCHTVERASASSNIFEPYRRGDPEAKPVHNVMGHDVRLDAFYADLVESGLATSEDVLAAARKLRGRIDLVLPENDEFSSAELKARLIDAAGAQGRTLALEGVGHDIGRSPAAMKAAFNYLLAVAQDHFAVPEDERTGLLPEPALVGAARVDRAAIEAVLKISGRRTALAS